MDDEHIIKRVIRDDDFFRVIMKLVKSGNINQACTSDYINGWNDAIYYLLKHRFE